MAALVTALKAAAEPTRLRILALLAEGALSVKDLTNILGQSQPRISRHLRLLNEAGLIDRAPEGSWVFFHLAENAEARELALALVGRLSPRDATLVRDHDRAQTVKRERESRAQSYFERHAGNWDDIRKLHVPEAIVEAALLKALGPDVTSAREPKLDLLVDLGTGTGRMLELFGPHFRRGIGIDLNAAMLGYARARLDRSGHMKAQVRQGSVYAVPVADGAADAVVIHQLLHFLGEPERAVAEAARILAPGGRLLIVDFAPHTLEFLRDEHAHERLGFAEGAITQMLEDNGLRRVRIEHLAPPDGAAASRLTVSLWIGEKPQ
jgi:ArsR family transcriptional regulator